MAWNWRGSTGGGGTSRCWWCGGTGNGERSAAAASSVPVSSDYNASARRRTVETSRRAQNGLDDAHDALESLPDVGIFGLDRLLLAQHNLEIVIGLLALEIADALVQAVDLRLGALSDGALGLAVVCALSSELLGGEVCDATRGGGRAALFRGRLARIGLTVVLSRKR